jgi:hypothetical protein
MFPTINERIGKMSKMRNQVCERLPLNHPFQPQVIQPLNMVVPNEVNVEPSSSQPPSPEPTQDTTVIDNLVSHYSGELPEVRPSLQRASEISSEEVASESPQQQSSKPQMTSTTNTEHTSSPEHVSTSEHVSVCEHVVLEHSVPEQSTPEHTTSSTISEYIVPEQYVPGQILTPSIPETLNEPDNIITSKTTDMEIDQSFSTEVIETVSDQPSTSNTQTSNSTNGQSSSSLAIVPLASPKPTKIPSPPTLFLDSTLLQNVCENMGQELVKLIKARDDLVHIESFEKHWSRLKERVDYVMSALQTSCLDIQAQAQQKLQDWLKGIDNSLQEVKILRTWVQSP